MKAFLFVVLIFSCACISHARVIKADPTRSIQQAIQIANPFDTILVAKGVYKEGNLVVQKPVYFIGEDGATLDGENKYEIFTIHAQGGTIQNLIFRNTGIASINDLAAIKVLQSSKWHIFKNTFENCFFGIYLANSSHCWIENNKLTSDAEAEQQIGNGIHLWKCERITIQNNWVKGHRDGIYFEFVTNSIISGNHSEANLRYGLHFMFSHSNEYRNNEFVNNGAGVAVMYTQKVKMIGNRFIHNWGSSAYGLLLKDIRDSEISGNVFKENSVGIFMEGSSRNQLSDNQFEANGYAVRLQASCDENNFERNNFKRNTFDMVTNGSLVLNKIKSNYWDRYDGYDLNHDAVGDVPYRPVSLYGTIVERMPAAVMLWHSFLVFLLDRAERAMPAITPENLKDDFPSMKPYAVAQSR